ncbi:DNA alkylation repair protein [Synechococcus sp. EJ6-Ellesmere]|uniref:DNA alkylation repair protein n=1 Tax=Synechococcus sp. EJ6-Ellesmere TaxID=2823734 RepID=UPI0020CF3627|nr:DNA alkylation repair protein [Synechococcus sp. EJ6-Ellesmere]MCP9823852.1 DNA alkylation repair protein [Synechococcus sp. EJ6-Ellesmere]
MQYPDLHAEVLSALLAGGNPALGRRIAADRRSRLEYVGISVPARRKLVRQGFSFSTIPDEQELNIWDELWMHSDNGDVLFCALDHVQAIVRRHVEPTLWPILRCWICRIENWCHADALSGIYSRLLEADQQSVLPALKAWNQVDELWYRRVSITSLVHNRGQNAVFLLPESVFPMLTGCLDDHRDAVQKAIGWVLREMNRVFPVEVRGFLDGSLTRIGATALSRATEHWNEVERRALRERRKQAMKSDWPRARPRRGALAASCCLPPIE